VVASPASPASNTRSKKKVGFEWKSPLFWWFGCKNYCCFAITLFWHDCDVR
jgi:hypothetical protein